MAMQSVRLRRAVTSLFSLHRSFYSPITPAHSPLPQISDSTSLSVQPLAPFRFPSRCFSWFSSVSGGKEDSFEGKEDSAEGKDDNVSKEEDGVVLSTDSGCKCDASKEESDDLTLSKDKDAEAIASEESDDLMLSKDKDAESVSKEGNDDSTLTKDKDSEEDLLPIDFADWLFSKDRVLNEDDEDSLFKNVKPLSEYNIDEKLTEEGKDFMNIFKKYDIKAMMAKAKEQEQNDDSMKEYEGYEGYNFMRRREEEYPFNFFEDEEPRVPKNEDDIMEVFAGCDLKHWLVTVDFPDDPEPKPEEMIATYERVCAEGLGVSIEEAKKRIYACSTTVYQGFQVEMTKEESEKFIEVPEVCLVLPDSYMDRKNEEYGGDKYENGVITPRPPPFTWKKKPKKAKNGEKAGDKDKKATLRIPEKGGGSVASQGRG